MCSFSIEYEKNCSFSFLRGFSLGARNFKKMSDPFISEKKIVPLMGFMVFKSTGLDSRFQRKNRFWKICTESQDITKKVSKIGLPNQTSKIWHILADISGLGAYFSKPIFALKPWVRAGRFEYHQPHNPNDFFFTYKGVRAILSAISSSENGPNSNFWVQILVKYIYIQVFWL